MILPVVDFLLGQSKFQAETPAQMTELGRFKAEPVVPMTTNVLAWSQWWANQERFPHLAEVARNLL